MAKCGFGMRTWLRQLWSSGVSLERSCKMQFRRIDSVSIGPPAKSYDQILIFGQFSHRTYNVKLQSGGLNRFMGAENFGVSFF